MSYAARLFRSYTSLRGSISLEYALFVSAAACAAAIALPIFFSHFGGYIEGFHD
jgi:hypothetical protein